MTTTIDETIKALPDLASAIERADRILASVIGHSSERLATYLGEVVTAHWKEGRDDHNRRTAKLTLSYPSSSVGSTFRQDELKNPSRLERRFSQLWGDLLREISHQQMAKLRQDVSELEEG